MGNGIILGGSLGDKNTQVSVPCEITRPTDTVHDIGTANVGRVYIAVNIKFDGRIDSNYPQPANQTGRVTDILGSQYHAVFIFLQVVEYPIIACWRHRD